jgi:flavin reductase (DIM6/NTAB) family NADH-FMN oxidoreductase RutF
MPPTNKPFFPDLRPVKKVVNPQGELLIQKECKCGNEFLGPATQTRSVMYRTLKAMLTLLLVATIVITLCFSMYCSYKPPVLAVAIQNINASYDLIQRADEYVLAVPGTSLARDTLYCGIKSMAQVDKVKELKIALLPSERVSVPGLRNAIANVEMVKEQCVKTGDHVLVIGRALAFRVNRDCRDSPLISVGPDTSGYKVWVQKGIHRIATVAKH